MRIVFIIVALIFILKGCGCHDSNYIPYDLKGMDSWVYDTNDKEYYAGRAEGNYFEKDNVLAECGNLAAGEAEEKHLENWSYVCCTVTSKSDCNTKVR